VTPHSPKQSNQKHENKKEHFKISFTVPLVGAVISDSQILNSPYRPINKNKTTQGKQSVWRSPLTNNLKG